MSNKNSNFPSNQLNNLPPETCAEITSCLMELNQQGKPKTKEELQKRIDDYFSFCGEKGMRVGIETLCCALSVSRQTLWQWCSGSGCSKEWAEICRNAKQFILAFLETLTLSGKLNPANSIFYLKNWGNYRDTVPFDDNIPKDLIPTRTAAEIAAQYERFAERPEVPEDLLI